MWYVTGTFHGAHIYAPTEGAARRAFHLKYNGESIIHIRKYHETNTRQPGYYRVLYKSTNRPDILEWAEGSWYKAGIEMAYEDYEVEVTDPTPIDPNPPKQPAGQLTANEMVKPFIENVTEPDGTILDVVAPGRAAVIAEQYAAQQTAALRDELHEISSKKASMDGDYILQVRALQQELEAAKLKAQSAEWQEEQNSKACQALIHAAAKERDQAKEELEALKRDRDALRDDVRRLCIIISKKRR